MRDYGIRIDSDRGEASRRGFTLNWTYEPSGHTLRIECSQKPFLIPCSAVNSRIQQMAEGCGLTAR